MILIFGFSSSLSKLILAESESENSEENIVDYHETSHGYISVKADIQTQQVFTKKIPIKVTFTPKVDGRSCYINIISPSQVEMTKAQYWIDFEKDESSSKTIYIKPSTSGTFDIRINVIVYGYDINYGDSTSVRITVNEDLIVEESISAYRLNMLVYTGVLLVVVVAVIIIMIKFGKQLLSKAKKWLFSDSKYQKLQNQKEMEGFYQKLATGSVNQKPSIDPNS